jgi:hypothetical protein
MRTISDLKHSLSDLCRDYPKHHIKSTVFLCSRPLNVPDYTVVYCLDEIVESIYAGFSSFPCSCDSIAFTDHSIVFIEFKSPFCCVGEEYKEILRGLRIKPIVSLSLFDSLIVKRTVFDELDPSLLVEYCIVTDSPNKAMSQGNPYALALANFPGGTSSFHGFLDIKKELEKKWISASNRIFFNRVTCFSTEQFIDFAKKQIR